MNPPQKQCRVHKISHLRPMVRLTFSYPMTNGYVELDAKNTAKDPEQGSGPDTVSAEIKKPELKPDTSGDPDYPVDSEQHAAEAAAEVIPLAGKVSGKPRQMILRVCRKHRYWK